MKQDDLILTIAIPVFNEINYLPAVINSIEEQTTFSNRDLFDVVVSVNGSTDGTFEYLKSLEVNFRLTILYNNENVSADINFTKAILNANGKYVWLLGGQDFLSSSAIDVVISKIQTFKPEMILLNFFIYDEIENTGWINRSYDHVNDELFDSSYKFFVETGGPGFAISSNVFLKEFYLFGDSFAKHYPNWTHIESFYSAIFGGLRRRKIRYVFIKEPMFSLVRERNAWWHSDLVLKNYLVLIELGLSKIKNPALNYRIRYRRCGKELYNSLRLGLEEGFEPKLRDLARIVRLGWPIPQFWIQTFPHFLHNFVSRKTSK